MEELEDRPQSLVKRGLSWAGVKMPKKRWQAMYGLRTPKGVYPTDKSAADINLISFSADKIRRTYGLPLKEEMTLEALHSDTRSDLIRELVEEYGLNRETATKLVNGLIKKGIIIEYDDPDGGKRLLL